MPWIIGLMAMARGFAAAAFGGCNRSGTQVAQINDLIEDVDPMLYQGFQGLLSHKRSGHFPSVLYTHGYLLQKKNSSVPHIHVVRPVLSSR